MLQRERTMNDKPIPGGTFIAVATLGFVVFAPLYTYILLVLRGLPAVAISHQLEVVIWVYRSTWLAALISGVVVSAFVLMVVRRTVFFFQPFDFGRCFSLSGVTGAIVEVPATCLHRTLSNRPHSDFWIAGAMMAGFLSGATFLPGLLWHWSRTSKTQ